MFHRLGIAAGVPGRHHPHRWRHAYATGLLQAGISLEHIRRLLGHASITTTSRYLHLDDLTTAVNHTFHIEAARGERSPYKPEAPASP